MSVDWTFQEGGDLPLGPLLTLYASVGWTAYTEEPEALLRALANSTWVLSVWWDGDLIGLARVVSDEVAIAWLQDLLVRPDHQRTGLGKALIAKAQERFAHVRTFGLLTDDEPRQHTFYRSVGLLPLKEVAGGRLHTFLRPPRS
ncbi:MAG: GNAT family N-acetyltransferase [Alphaproteobacteria bacterium]|nr:GNAT family N-acetyltransferase [Alphaproteobacteria bacterium]